MTIDSTHRRRRPTHPGAILREDVLPDLQMSVTEAAGRLGISRQTLHKILAEKSPVTAEMALRLGKFCGNGPGLWLRMQQQVDLWDAERSLSRELAKISLAKASCLRAIRDWSRTSGRSTGARSRR